LLGRRQRAEQLAQRLEAQQQRLQRRGHAPPPSRRRPESQRSRSR
jgi:hypothetical protein